MSGVDHLPSAEYRRSAERSPNGRLCLRAHQHLVSACPECGKDWEELGPKLQGLVRQELATAPPLSPPPEPHRDDLSGSDEAVELLADQAATLRRNRRRAKKQLSELRLLPAERRADKVRGAYRRFRSRLLAELLIEEARSVVRNAPAEAESFASLVPLVLDWAKGEEHSTWAPTLVARATAHRANALRVAGELNKSALLLRQIDLKALPDPASRAEILSLEGSLRTDQRQFEAAEQILRKAAQTYEYVGDRLGVAKVSVKQANLMQVLFRTQEVLTLFERADAEVAVHADPHLKISTVTGRVNALCDLDRPAEARRVLHDGLDAFEEFDTPYAAGLYRMLEGRIHLGLEEYTTAESLFRDSSGTMRSIGRHLDAAAVSLFLAEALLAQGRMEEIHRLAANLVAEFKSQDAEIEARRALHLFRRAVLAENLSATLLAQLRRSLLSVG